MTERTRVGIIGAGAIVQVAHLPVLRRMKNLDLVAICDSDLPKARVVADRFKITDAFDDIEELLQYEELDVLLICTPNHLHESHVLAALSRGLHVLVEKPLATSADSVKRIKKAVDKHDRVLMVGMKWLPFVTRTCRRPEWWPTASRSPTRSTTSRSSCSTRSSMYC